MAADSKSRKILKLVHPGGIAEIHRKPITAGEIMKKNPRHCVTRPDVFRFPWVVVHPESVLKPGRIFYVVPYHTLHRLRKSMACKDHHYCQETFPAKDSDSWGQPEDALVSIDSSVLIFDELSKEQSCDYNTAEIRSKVDCRFEHLHQGAIFPRCLLRTNKQCLDPCLDKPSLIKPHFDLDSHPSLYDSPKKLFQLKDLETESAFHDWQDSKLQSPVKSWSKPKNVTQQLCDSSEKLRSKEAERLDTFFGNKIRKESKRTSTKSCFELKNSKNDRDSPKKIYPVEGWERTVCYKNCIQNNERSSLKSPHNSLRRPPFNEVHKDRQENAWNTPVNCITKSKSRSSSVIGCNVAQLRVAFPKIDDGFAQCSSHDDNALKPCLKKGNSVARMQGLRVTFSIPLRIPAALSLSIPVLNKFCK